MSSPAASRPLTDLVGESRATILDALQRGPATAGDLADDLGVTPAAVRRHLGAMQADELVDSETVRDGTMGRPADHWSLTPRGRRLFADRATEFAQELLDHIEATFGRAAVAAFLKDRNERKADDWAGDLDGEDPADRARQLAELLSADGFAARVEPGDNARSLTLLQSHCAIEGIAKQHPEICAHEAALFKRLLGTDDQTVRVSRRETIAGGARACVCHVDLPDTADTTRDQPPANSNQER